MITHISIADVLTILVLKKGLEAKNHCQFLIPFTDYVNQGSSIAAKDILHYLIGKTNEYCGISEGYRTVTFDFAGTLFRLHPELWTDEERKINYANVLYHWKELYPEDDGVFEDYDVVPLHTKDYYKISMDMITNGSIEAEHLPIFCYAAYIFFADLKD